MSNHLKIFNLTLQIVLVLAISGAKATILTVDNINDTGAGSLRQSIIDAAEGDTIRFNPNLIAAGNAIIKLASEITFSKGIVLKGLYNDKDTLVISGENNSRIFNVNLETASLKFMIIDSMVLMNGNVTELSEHGGAICIKNVDSLIVRNSILKNNNCINGSGGAISSSTSAPSSINYRLRIINSIISNNYALFDGGGISSSTIEVRSLIMIDNSTFSNNITNESGGFALGGGVSSSVFNVFNNPNTVDQLIISNSTFNGNSSTGSGGGISSNSSVAEMAVNNCTFYNNNCGGRGGGISTLNGSGSSKITIINSTITGNNAGLSGGGVSSSFIASEDVEIIVGSSIIAFNGANNIFNRNDTIITSLGYNIFSDGSLLGNISSDQLNATESQLNLGPLQNNGGATFTLLPGRRSIAINNGNPSDNSDAQNRSIVGRRDVGATETISCLETDTTPPNITCPNDTLITITGTVTTLMDYANNITASDDCSDTLTFIQTPPSGTSIGEGTTTVIIRTTDNTGNTDSCFFNVVVNLSVGIDNISNNNNIDLFPNPTNGLITIMNNDVEPLSKIDIYDVNGHILKTITLKNNEQQISISLAMYQNGIYFVRLLTQNNSIIKRLIKQ